MVEIDGANADSILEHSLPLQDVDQSHSFDDMSSDPDFANTNILVHLHDPGEEDMPSEKFNDGIFLGVFLVVVTISAVFAMIIIYISKMSEKRKSSTNQRMEATTMKKFKKNIECKPWSGDWNHKTEVMMDESFNMSKMSTSSESSGSNDSNDGVGGPQGRAPSPSPSPSSSSSRCDSPAKDLECGCNVDETMTCALCTKQFEYGQPVYSSNNPQCSHVFHKVCMDRWLTFQNTCPTCNQPFVLQTK